MKKCTDILIIVLIVLTGSTLFAQQAEQPVSKTYRVMYKTVREFEPLVRAMLSNRGEIEISEKLNLMVVRDRQASLAQIDSLFLRYDKPAQQFFVKIYLLLGSNDMKAVSSPDSTALRVLLDPLFSFARYEELDKAFIRTEEKVATTFDLAEGQFSVSLEVDYIPDADSPIRFRRFEVNELIRDISGKTLKPVYMSSAEVKENVQQVFVAVKHEGTGKTLIIVVSASRVQ